jgi:hypothetical protein
MSTFACSTPALGAVRQKRREETAWPIVGRSRRRRVLAAQITTKPLLDYDIGPDVMS